METPALVLITGGAQGIGKGIALRFGQKGYRVCLADLDAEAGEECAGWLESQGVSCLFCPTDVSDPALAAKAVSAAVAWNGKLNALINNAGVSVFGTPPDGTPPDIFMKVLETNLAGAYYMGRSAAPHLAKTGNGSIVNIASTRALMSEPQSEAYAASKGGLLALTHAQAVSLGPKVRVNAVSPGWIETGDWQKAANRTAPSHSAADKAQHLVGRVGNPTDVAATVFFLCSDEAAFITGQNFVVDGGMTVKMVYV